jgi:hypothetical protein
MSERSLQPLCTACGRPVEGVEGERGVRCEPCFDAYLRSVDAGFLEHYAEFGVRARRVVAETCLRALVLANAADRKLLGLTIYEQFVGAATDLMALVAALRARAAAPIARTFLEFRPDAETARRFFADLCLTGGVDFLAALGLPPPERVQPALPRAVNRDVVRALREALADLARLRDLRDLGERALALAAAHFQAGVTVAGRTGHLAGRELSPAQVASVALDARRGRLDIAALRVDEERLAQVVDAIDVMTRLARNLTYAFVTLHEPEAFAAGFRDPPRVRAG